MAQIKKEPAPSANGTSTKEKTFNNFIVPENSEVVKTSEKKLYKKSRCAYYHELYEWRKAHHICTYCGHENAVKGKTRCVTCAEKLSERSSKRYAAKKYHTEENFNAARRREKLRDLRIAFGVCTRCGKRNSTPGFHTCLSCRAHAKAMNVAYRRKMGVYPCDDYSDLCTMCNKKPPLDGKKLCGECYEKTLRNLSKANAAIKNEKHIWRAMDNLIFNKNKAAGGAANEV